VRVAVCPVEELAVGSRRIVTAGEGGIGVFNVDGKLYALANRCPHAGGPLCRGVLTGTTEPGTGHEVRWVREGRVLRCPWHSWEFDIATGRTLTKPTVATKTFSVVVEDGTIYVEV
jgi:nitrite reductase/ring-hydroxylating ferredoxin subunit